MRTNLQISAETAKRLAEPVKGCTHVRGNSADDMLVQATTLITASRDCIQTLLDHLGPAADAIEKASEGQCAICGMSPFLDPGAQTLSSRPFSEAERESPRKREAWVVALNLREAAIYARDANLGRIDLDWHYVFEPCYVDGLSNALVVFVGRWRIRPDAEEIVARVEAIPGVHIVYA